MHCVQLAQLAAALSIQTPTLRRTSAHLSDAAMVAYWTATRSRQELWDRTLGRYHQASRRGDAAAVRRWWGQHHGVLEEILVGELAGRVVAALAGVLDRLHGQSQWSPVTDTVFRSHLSTSNRVASILLCGRGHSVTQAVQLNRLRLAAERWSDTLVGQMIDIDEPEMGYAADRRRAGQIASEWSIDNDSPESSVAKQLARAAMIDTLARRTSTRAALPRSTAAVAESMLQMMQIDWFDSDGLMLPPEVAAL